MSDKESSDATTPFRQYCRDIYRYPLLTHEETVLAAEQMYHHHHKLLDLLLHKRSGKEYLVHAFTHNSRYEKYQVHSTPPIPLEKIIQEVNPQTPVADLMEEIFMQGGCYWLRTATHNYLKDHPQINGSPRPLEYILKVLLKSNS